MPRLLCMKRPKIALSKIIKKEKMQNEILDLPALNELFVDPNHHHPLCSSDEKYIFINITNFLYFY